MQKTENTLIEIFKNNVKIHCNKAFVSRLAKLEVGQSLSEIITLKAKNKERQVPLTVLVNEEEKDAIDYSLLGVSLHLCIDSIDLLKTYEDIVQQHGFFAREFVGLTDEKHQKYRDSLILIDYPN